MKKHCLHILLLMTLILLSCEHRPLIEQNLKHYIRVYLDEEIPNVTCGIYNPELERPEYKSPEVLRVVLASPQTGRIISQRNIDDSGEDERGKYIEGYIIAPAGVYDLMIYSIGSSITLIRESNDFYKMEAYTNPVSERLLQYLPETRKEVSEEEITYQPDHLFHQICEQMNISLKADSDTLRNESGDYFTARSIVKSYYLQINVKGLEYVRSAASLLSGMAGSSRLYCHNGMVESDPVHVFFGMNQSGRGQKTSDDNESAILYSTFNTFGKIDGIPSVYTVNLEFNLNDGSTITEQIDITDMFNTPQVEENQWIIIDKEIEIVPPEGSHGGGGMRPGIEGWEDIEADIEM